MVDILRRGSRAAETMIGGLYGGAAFSGIANGGSIVADVLWITFFYVIVTGLYIAIAKYYESRKGEPIT